MKIEKNSRLYRLATWKYGLDIQVHDGRTWALGAAGCIGMATWYFLVGICYLAGMGIIARAIMGAPRPSLSLTGLLEVVVIGFIAAAVVAAVLYAASISLRYLLRLIEID